MYTSMVMTQPEPRGIRYTILRIHTTHSPEQVQAEHELSMRVNQTAP